MELRDLLVSLTPAEQAELLHLLHQELNSPDIAAINLTPNYLYF